MGNNFKSDLCCHNESSENQEPNFITVITNFFICANISKKFPFTFIIIISYRGKERSLVLACHRQIKQSSKKCEMFFAKMYNNNNI